MLRVAILLAPLFTAACVVGPNFSSPATPNASGYAGPGDVAATRVQLMPSESTSAAWWMAFNSPALNALVDSAFAHNQTLAEADAHLEEARADALATRGGVSPQVNLNAAAVRERINTQTFGIAGFPSPTLPLYSIGGSVSFDTDLFGGRHRAIERDDARADAAAARRDAASLSLSGNVVQQAILIAGLSAKVGAQNDIINSDQRVLSMVRQAIAAGGQAPAAANGIQAQLAEDQAALPPLQQQLAEARHRLALYLGRTPADGPSSDLALDALSAPEQIPVALPSTLVRKRPDIVAAEADLHAATAQIGVDTAALYPNLSLSAALTQSAVDPADVFDRTAAGWSIGPSITAPIFHGGALHQQVHRANAAQRAALAVYQQTVLEAFMQVADVLAGVSSAEARIDAENRALRAAHATVRTSEIAYREGAGTLLSLVDAQRQASRAQQASIDARVALLQNVAALYVATAADWRAAPP